jgi:hypothetical protein
MMTGHAVVGDTGHQQRSTSLMWQDMGYRKQERPTRSSVAHFPSTSRYKSLACCPCFRIYSRVNARVKLELVAQQAETLRSIPGEPCLTTEGQTDAVHFQTLRKARRVTCRHSQESQSATHREQFLAVHGTTVLALEVPNTREVALVRQIS